MSRYLEVDEVYKWLRAGCAYVIWDLPIIDIVQCKECKYYYYDVANDAWFCKNHEYGETYRADDFCSMGERSE